MVSDILVSLLCGCFKSRSLHYRTSLHALAIKAGLQNVFISNHIINMYAKCGNLDYAHQLFDEMSDRNLVSWSALISGYDQARDPFMALDLFRKMRVEMRPNEFCFSSALSSCSRLMSLRIGQQLHSDALKLGYSSISFVCNSLIKLYSKCGQCNDAVSVFDSASGLICLVSYNVIIAGLVANKELERGFDMFRIMRRQGLIPDHFTFMGLLGTRIEFWTVAQLHCLTIKFMLDSMPIIGNVLIAAYRNFQFIEEAEKVFNSIELKDVISWNTMIAACSFCDDHVRAFTLFREMGKKEITQRPDEFTYTSVLSASAGLASLRHGKQIHAHLMRTRSGEDVGVGNALVNMYAKCGSIMHAKAVFDQMSCYNIFSCNAMIVGFANHGLGERAVEMFGLMKNMGIKPDSVTFLGLLIACNHAGLVDDGLAAFNSMASFYGIPPNIEHFSCLIDLLGRAGKFDEAEEYVQKYNFGDDQVVVLGCLLSACRLYGNVVTGERLAKQILHLQPVTPSPYVLLSNLYACNGMWDGVAGTRKMLRGSGMKKEAGHSLIDVQGFLEKFIISDFSHSMIEEILEILRILRWNMDNNLLCY